MLFYPILQSLGCASYVARITLARKYNNPSSDVLCSEECQTKKLLVCCKIFAFSKPFSNSIPQKNYSHFSSNEFYECHRSLRFRHNILPLFLYGN